MPGQIPEYPEDCIQSLIDPWWTTSTDREVRRGQLIWAFVPHVDLEPMTLHPEERSVPTDHQRIRYRLEPLRSSQRLPSPPLPIAAMPTHPGEVRTVYRAKLRPVVVVSLGGHVIGKALRLGAARWQSNPTLLVAPYYGADQSDKRGGWKPELFAGFVVGSIPNTCGICCQWGETIARSCVSITFNLSGGITIPMCSRLIG